MVQYSATGHPVEPRSPRSGATRRPHRPSQGAQPEAPNPVKTLPSPGARERGPGTLWVAVRVVRGSAQPGPVGTTPNPLPRRRNLPAGDRSREVVDARVDRDRVLVQHTKIP